MVVAPMDTRPKCVLTPEPVKLVHCGLLPMQDGVHQDMVTASIPVHIRLCPLSTIDRITFTLTATFAALR